MKGTFLSNMYPCEISLDGIWPSAEAAYQGAKAIDPEVREQFRHMNPYEAKKYGRKIAMRTDFNRLEVMERILRAKFTIPELRQKLMDTKGDLVEHNTWGDTFWGVCGTGSNHLGKILMKIRQELWDNHGFLRSEFEVGERIYEEVCKSNSKVVVKPWYGRDGVAKAKAIGAVFTLRVPGMRYHLGNPYGRKAPIKVWNIRRAVICYICWCLFSQEERAVKIREWLASGVLKGKTLIYYTNLGEPSHATALEWLINNDYTKFSSGE